MLKKLPEVDPALCAYLSLPYKAQSDGQPINDLCGMGHVVDNTH